MFWVFFCAIRAQLHQTLVLGTVERIVIAGVPFSEKLFVLLTLDFQVVRSGLGNASENIASVLFLLREINAL